MLENAAYSRQHFLVYEAYHSAKVWDFFLTHVYKYRKNE